MVSFAFCGIVFAVLAMASAFQNPAVPLQQQNLQAVPIPQEVVFAPPQPYQFGYESLDDLGTKQHRKESADATGAVKGSYGFTDPLGVYRRVEYIADDGGYRATVHSNEPGMTSNGVADATYFVEVPPPAVIAQGLAYLKPQLNTKFAI